jgi:DNA-binding transcriptional ArsR family regulator
MRRLEATDPTTTARALCAFVGARSAEPMSAAQRASLPQPHEGEAPELTSRPQGGLPCSITSSTFVDVKEASALFRLLGDEARLRLLRVLARDRFNVTELTGILGLAQSGISRHLGLLKEAGLVAEERSGAFTYYRMSSDVRANGNGALWPLLEAQFAAHQAAADVRADEARLQEVLRLRRENFDAHTGPDTRDGRRGRVRWVT